MLINNKSFETLEAIFIGFAYTTPEISSNILSNGLSQVDMGMDCSPSLRTLQLAFENDLAMSNFMAEIAKQFTIFDEESNLYYDCILNSTPQIQHLGNLKYLADYTVSCVCHGPLKTVRKLLFDAEGNTYGGCIYKITSSKNISNFKINDYTISELEANRIFIIDGMDKLVYYQDDKTVSMFDEVQGLIKFPVVTPGENEIILSDENVVFELQYYPMYL
ncbi:hypothetical protein [Thomasclavelia cocleata]|uniref:hypothetical protein n=1 Tax=Thomasclavelia cocleata TaxID=69824 RepID=UPI0024951EB6|nr:hypothetical protein [Thomasclavelia cocleata]